MRPAGMRFGLRPAGSTAAEPAAASPAIPSRDLAALHASASLRVSAATQECRRATKTITIGSSIIVAAAMPCADVLANGDDAE